MKTEKHQTRAQQLGQQLPLPNVPPDVLTEEQARFQIGRLQTLINSFVSSARQQLQGVSLLLATQETRGLIWSDFMLMATDIQSIAARLRIWELSSTSSLAILRPDGTQVFGADCVVVTLLFEVLAELFVEQ